MLVVFLFSSVDRRNIVDAVDLDESVRPNSVYRALGEYIRFQLTEPFRKNVWPMPVIVCIQIIFSGYISAENLKN